jgi:uncharacterized protein YndB with AHSA1/START domain
MNAKPHKTVEVTRRFDASAERVFDAWLIPDKAGKFLFATPMGEMVRAEIDPRVGGRFLFIDRREGIDVEHFGEYLEIDRPRRLVFTFAVTGFEDHPTRITITITAQGEGCELTLTHEDVQEEYADRTEAGWNTILGNLAASLGA